MQGYNPTENSYIQTWDDGYYLLFWIVVFTGARVAVMDFLLWPLAKWGGIRTAKGRTRFAEQGWLFLYYSASWSTGMVSSSSMSSTG
jgi:acyl-CoA-dependent ceramide synthase